MGIILFVVFLLCNLMTVGIVWAVYAGKEKYQEGMVLGVHIPKEHVLDEGLQSMLATYKKKFTRGNLLHLFLGAFMCLSFFYSGGGGIILWTLWLTWYLIQVYGLILKTHRRIYDYKMENDWIMEKNQHQILIDTRVSAQSAHMPHSHWWHMIFVVLITGLYFLPGSFSFFESNQTMRILPGTALFVALLFWFLHVKYCYRKNTVYAQDTNVNQAVNRLEKRTWSIVFLLMNAIGSAGMIYLYLCLQWKGQLKVFDFWLFITLEVLASAVMVIGLFFIRREKEKMLSNVTILTVDDDVYWKNGWYHNPEDKKILVPDRLNSSSYSMNTAKRGVRIAIGAMYIGFFVLMIGVGMMLLPFDHVSITMQEEGSEVIIKGAGYSVSFEEREIQSVALIEELPKEYYIRTNGGATGEYLVGHFKGDQTGKCMMFLYKKYAPILKIELPGQVVYVNSKDPKETKTWYETFLLLHD